MSQCVLYTLKVGNVRAQDPNERCVGVVGSTANEGASNALGAVKCETRSDVAVCADMIEARLGER